MHDPLWMREAPDSSLVGARAELGLQSGGRFPPGRQPLGTRAHSLMLGEGERSERVPGTQPSRLVTCSGARGVVRLSTTVLTDSEATSQRQGCLGWEVRPGRVDLTFCHIPGRRKDG